MAPACGPHPERDFILREHIEIPNAKWRQINWAGSDSSLFSQFGGCYDVMGDGSMIALPTPGHTKGSISLLVRREAAPPVLLVGDLTYEVDLLMNNQFPGTGDKEQLAKSFANVRKLKERLPDLIILPSHDFKAAQAIAA